MELPKLIANVLICVKCDMQFSPSTDKPYKCAHLCSVCTELCDGVCDECNTDTPAIMECSLKIKERDEDECDLDEEPPIPETTIFDEPFRILAEEIKKGKKSYTMPQQLVERAKKLGYLPETTIDPPKEKKKSKSKKSKLN